MELIWIGSAYVAGMLASRLALPPLVGYLVAGYVLYLFGVRPDELLSRLSEIGILLLLFTVGLKLRIRSLFKVEVLGVGGMHLLVVAAISGLMFFLMNQHVTGGLILGVSLAFSSTVLAVKVLEDSREIAAFHGRTVMGILILQDIIAVALFAFVGARTPTPWALGLLAVPLFRPFALWVFELTRNDELRLLLGILFAFAGGRLAQYVGISEDLGALLMGVLLAGHPDSSDLGRKLWALKEALLVAFFLQIGLFGVPSAEQIMTALGLLAALPLQGALFFVLLIVAGLRARTAFVASLALMTYSEFALIASEPMIDSGLLSPDWEPILGFSVAGSLAIAAFLNRYSHALFSRCKPWLVRFERRVPHPDQLPASLGNAEWLIVGMGRTGRAAYETFEKGRHKVVGLDADPNRVAQLREDGFRVQYGDSEDHELWANTPLDRLRGVILSLPDFRARQLVLTRLRAQGFAGSIGTTAFRPDEVGSLYRLGADVVFQPFAEAGEKLAERMLDDLASIPATPVRAELVETVRQP